MDSLHQIRPHVVRLERYCRRTKDKIWSGDRRDLIQAMADVAETAEIARRLYSLIGDYISGQSSNRTPSPLAKDEPEIG